MRTILPTIFLGFVWAAGIAAAEGDDAEFFESRIRPLLVERCYGCHSVAKKQEGGLRLDSQSGWQRGGDSGPAIIVSHPEKSLLMERVRELDADLVMPPKAAGKPLTAQQIADLEEWINRGAFDPRDDASLGTKVAADWETEYHNRLDWWSLRPVREVAVPEATDAAWSRSAVDRFLRQAMTRREIEPAPAADPLTLLRRASLVLTGLPPSPEQIAEYQRSLTSDGEHAYGKLVDRLLDSSHYGERFARHWLDVVRFSETHGNEWNYDAAYAWRYRDYVIRAFNADVPYDRFVREQIAGDLLSTPRHCDGVPYDESPLGTAFYRFGEVNHDSCTQFPVIGYDILDNQLDTLTKAFQATTAETLSLATVYQRAGFDVSMSPNESVIPVADAGANGTWSDDEMHNAMVTYWSRFQDRAQWAMWVLYAARHDQGRGLGGIMFDDIGPNHRQGTALFTDSFIQDAPASDPNAVAWRRRMVFWTAVHEMGHAFNLAHAWQKTLGTPWTSVVNEPEGRSFMNYPFRVTGGQASFFSDFRHRFSDQELLFMRHAPRRFVQMGNSNWFDNHAFESPSAREKSAAWALAVRPNRTSNTFQFLEPVVVELKLTNLATRGVAVDDDLLSDGMHVAIMIRRDGGQAKRWRPFITRCHEEHEHTLKPGEALYASHAVSMAPAGWLIDEPGFYSIQAMLEVGGEVVHSNVLRIYVAPSNHHAENRLAPDYFTENVGRAIAFGGAPSLADANTVLQAVVEECKENPARIHAVQALTAPLLTPFKVLAFDDEKPAIRSLKGKLDQASKALMAALVEAAGTAADTLGHIGYFGQLDDIAAALEDEGDAKAAKKVLQASVAAMKEREILPAVIQLAEKRLAKM